MITSAVKALDMGFSASLLSQTQICTKFIVPEAHFQPSAIGARPTVIARKTTRDIQILILINSYTYTH